MFHEQRIIECPTSLMTIWVVFNHADCVSQHTKKVFGRLFTNFTNMAAVSSKLIYPTAILKRLLSQLRKKKVENKF